MTISDTLRYTRFHGAHGSGMIPAVGFGTLIPDRLATKQATKAALEVGFRHLDCAERHVATSSGTTTIDPIGSSPRCKPA